MKEFINSYVRHLLYAIIDLLSLFCCLKQESVPRDPGSICTGKMDRSMYISLETII